jgi:hypothetical protein
MANQVTNLPKEFEMCGTIAADREEVYSAVDAYYAPSGHLPVLEAGCEYVEFSPIEPYVQTMEVVGRNMQAMAPGQ